MTTLPDYKTYTTNFSNVTIVEVTANIEYVRSKAVAKNVIYRVYDTAKRIGNMPAGEYNFYTTASKAARRVNLLLKKAGINQILTFNDIADGLTNIIHQAQYQYDKRAAEERLKKFKNDFEQLLKKHKMHFEIVENGDYYSSWNEINLKDDVYNNTEFFEDIIDSYETTNRS